MDKFEQENEQAFAMVHQNHRLQNHRSVGIIVPIDDAQDFAEFQASHQNRSTDSTAGIALMGLGAIAIIATGLLTIVL